MDGLMGSQKSVKLQNVIQNIFDVKLHFFVYQLHDI
jgi:hypothetical protein